MKDFRSLMIVRHPSNLVWTTVRDRLPELIERLPDIEGVIIEERRQQPDGTIHIVNVWKAKPQIPSILAGALRADMLTWTDRAEWLSGGRECRWRIEPHFHSDRILCRGVTRYEPAMAGRGTRVVFEGTFEVATTNFNLLPAFVGQAASQAVESFITSLIPKNFQKLVTAAAALLDGAEQGGGDLRPR